MRAKEDRLFSGSLSTLWRRKKVFPFFSAGVVLELQGKNSALTRQQHNAVNVKPLTTTAAQDAVAGARLLRRVRQVFCRARRERKIVQYGPAEL